MQPPPLGCILHCALPGIALRAGGEIVGDLILRAELTPLRNGGINKSLLFLNNFFVAEISEFFSLNSKRKFLVNLSPPISVKNRVLH